MIPRSSRGTRGRHLANVGPADERDVRPHDIRPNRNAAKENVSSDRSLHGNLADRTEFFCPVAVEDDSDDPRTWFPTEDSGGSAVYHAAALATAEIVPGELLAPFRWNDTGVVLSTTASDAPPPGTLGCNTDSVHRTVGNGSRIPSADSIATRRDKRELASSSVLKHPEEGPRELCPGRSSLGLKVMTSVRGDYFHSGNHLPPTTTLQPTSAPGVNARGPTPDHQPPAV